MAKLTRIEQHAPTVRSYYFRADSCRDDDYRKAMNELTSFSFTVKNVHDDAADSLAMLADYLSNGIKTVSVGKGRFDSKSRWYIPPAFTVLIDYSL